MLWADAQYPLNLPAVCALKCIVNNTASSLISMEVFVFHDIVIKPSCSQRRPKLLNPIANCPLPIALTIVYCQLLIAYWHRSWNPDTPLKFGDLNSTLTLSPALNTWSCTSKIKPVSPLRISVPIRLCVLQLCYSHHRSSHRRSLFIFLSYQSIHLL